jgi:hypothetical protein
MYTHSTHRSVAIGLSVIALAALYFSLATPAEAKTLRSTSGITGTQSMATGTVPRVDNSCVAEAIEVREEALMAAFEEYYGSVYTALTERKTALVEAWNIDKVKDRTTAVKAAWKTWRTDNKTAHTQLRKDRKAAWDTFKKTAKNECKMNLPQEESLERAKNDTVVL